MNHKQAIPLSYFNLSSTLTLVKIEYYTHLRKF